MELKEQLECIQRARRVASELKLHIKQLTNHIIQKQAQTSCPRFPRELLAGANVLTLEEEELEMWQLPNQESWLDGTHLLRLQYKLTMGRLSKENRHLQAKPPQSRPRKRSSGKWSGKYENGTSKR
eukprot:jgi/Mesen1/5177/ME000257S04455